MVQTYKILMIAGVAVSAVLGGILFMDLSKGTFASKSYALEVDPIIDKQNMFTMGRITIQNTGSQPLTNVRVNFGEGDTLDLGTMDAGQKVILSPPPDNKMEFVQVSAEPDIFVSKAYREPPKMVGMMGS